MSESVELHSAEGWKLQTGQVITATSYDATTGHTVIAVETPERHYSTNPPGSSFDAYLDRLMGAVTATGLS